MFLVYSQTCWQWTLWRPTELDIHCAVLDKDEPLVDGFQVSKYFSFGYSLRKLGLRETRGGSEHKFKARQAEKGRKGGLAKGKIYYNKRISAQILKENGMSLAEIAREIDVSQVTIKRWFKK